jgi:hypothetical protein
MWLEVTREDGEVVGYLEPLTSDYAHVVPRSRLGHALGERMDYHQAEELVLGNGLAELQDPWLLDGAGSPLAIVQLSPDGVVLRDAFLSKGLMPSEEIHVPWPDTAGRLRR